MRHHGKVLAGTQRRRSSEPGTALQLLVLTATSDGGIGVDIASGALVRASYQLPEDAEFEFQPSCFDLVTASIASPDEEDLEPTLPEAVELAGMPQRVGRLSRRKAERFLRPLVHPPRELLLGIPGPTVQLWELRGNRPT